MGKSGLIPRLVKDVLENILEAEMNQIYGYSQQLKIKTHN